MDEAVKMIVSLLDKILQNRAVRNSEKSLSIRRAAVENGNHETEERTKTP